MSAALPVVVLAGTDAVDLEIAAGAVACDVPGVVGVRLEIEGGGPLAPHPGHPDAGRSARGDQVPRLTWRVADIGGVAERGEAPIAGDCANCSVRESITDLLERLEATRRWAGALVCLPAGLEPMPLALRLTRGCSCVGRLADRLHLARVVTVVDAAGVAGQLFGACPLLEDDEERGRREVLLSQVEFADTVVVAAGSHPSDTDLALLRHLARPGAPVVPAPAELDGAPLFEATHDIHRALAHADPRTCRPTGATPAAEVATVHVRSWKPFHPDRLLARFDQLAGSRGRCRGAFWLPGRPDVVMVLDAAGGAISLGAAGQWEGRERGSHLVVTCHESWAEEVLAGLEDALMTDAEMVGALETWACRCDGFEAWVGHPAA